MIGDIFAVVLLAFMTYVAYQSSVMVSEKKERQRKGLTDYYDNPITKDNKEVRCVWDLEKEG